MAKGQGMTRRFNHSAIIRASYFQLFIVFSIVLGCAFFPLYLYEVQHGELWSTDIGYLFPSKGNGNNSSSPTIDHEYDHVETISKVTIHQETITVTATATATATATSTVNKLVSITRTRTQTQTVASLPTPTRQPIIILQHMTDNSKSPVAKNDSRLLLDRSSGDHERYAKVHGYRYIQDRTSYVEEGFHSRRKSNNKIHSLIRTMLNELVKPEGERAEWIFMTDADTVICNPSIPLHHLIPSAVHRLIPEPLFLGIRDFNGFNNGNMIFRVNRRIIAFLSNALSIEESRAQKIMSGNKDVDPKGRIRDNFASDQESLSIALLSPENQDVQRGFYEMPCDWFNFYPEQFKDDYTHPPEERMILQVHYPNFRKWTYPLQPIVSHAENIYNTAVGNALNAGLVNSHSEGLELMDWYEKSKMVADDWWRTAKSGIDGIEFTTI
ncbi:uncharacterized protein L199_003093 [Kwoniella botswanensis]|uniref:uncharacterized protein n=1 Tax=Kwoniella botswanensis TaxID=1268659 RepID=UPI00315D98B2